MNSHRKKEGLGGLAKFNQYIFGSVNCSAIFVCIVGNIYPFSSGLNGLLCK